jgi:hypothetical protein
MIERQGHRRRTREALELGFGVRRKSLAHEGAKSSRIFCGSCSPTSRKETFAIACAGMTSWRPLRYSLRSFH